MKRSRYGKRLLQRGEGVVLAEVAQEAQDQVGAHAQLGVGVEAGAVQAADHDLHRHAARGVGLGVEEELGAHHVVGGRLLKVGPGHVVEILLLQQHAGAGVVDVEKALQVGEGIGATQRFHTRVRQRHPVALRQREDHLRLQRALDVNMQLGLGHGAQQFGQAVRGDRMDFEHSRTPESKRPPCGGLSIVTNKAYQTGAGQGAGYGEPERTSGT
jgi:hypothetical protein